MSEKMCIRDSHDAAADGVRRSQHPDQRAGAGSGEKINQFIFPAHSLCLIQGCLLYTSRCV